MRFIRLTGNICNTGEGEGITSTSRVSLVVLVAVIAGLIPPMAAASAATSLPSDLKVVVEGGGWGHGHGMSQYGARAQAGAGRSWRTILNSYYSDVDIVDGGSQSLDVLIKSSSSFIVGGPEVITAKWASGSTIQSTTDSYPYFRVRTVTEGLAIDKAATASGPWYGVTVGGENIRFTTSISLVPMVAGGKYSYYRGVLEANRRSSSTIYVLNRTVIERYLRGVVPRESPASWPMDALRAQAVAARSYTLWKKQNAGSSVYDICSTTQCQVYGGYGYRTSIGGQMTVIENSRTDIAITDTAQTIMSSAGKAIFAEYHSSSGGYTAQGSRSYLAPRPDPWDAEYSPYHRWTKTVAVADIEARWPALGRLSAIRSVARDGFGAWGGHVESMKLVGTAGDVTVSGNTFRIAFGLRSTLFRARIFDAQLVSAPTEVLLQPGETKTVTIAMKNTGTRSWPVGSLARLVTWNKKDRTSLFSDPSWSSPTRPTYATKDLTNEGGTWVSPGDTGGFTFKMTAPSSISSGLYVESFRLVADGLTIFGEPIELAVRIPFGGASHLGANLVDNASFEAAAASEPARWERYIGTSADARSTGTAVDGGASLRLTGDTAMRKAMRQELAVSGAAGDRYVISGWNKAKDVSASGGTIDLTVKLHNTDASTTTIKVEYPVTTHGWTYREASFIAPKRFSAVDIYTLLRYQTGWTWYDRIRLAREDLLNNGFEHGSTTPTSWTVVNPTAGSGSEHAIARAGADALRLKGSSKNVYARQYVSVDASAGSTYRLSGWNRTDGSSASGGAVRISARMRHADGSSAAASYDFPRGSHAWRYGELLMTMAKDTTQIDVFAQFADQSGTAWFDELSLAPVDSVRSLSGNSGFELGEPTPSDWTLIDTPALLSPGRSGTSALSIAGADGVSRYARQYLPIAGDDGDTFQLSGWNKTVGSTSTGGGVRISARVNYADGTSRAILLDFSKAAHDWTRKAVTFTTEKPYERIDVFVKYADQSGTAQFDSVRLQPVA